MSPGIPSPGRGVPIVVKKALIWTNITFQTHGANNRSSERNNQGDRIKISCFYYITSSVQGGNA